MTGRFVVRPKARRDIRDIVDYIAAENLDASDRFIDGVYDAFQLLARMPLMGKALADSGVRVSKVSDSGAFRTSTSILSSTDPGRTALRLFESSTALEISNDS